MLIHCTKRACERLKITPSVAENEFNPLYSWRLNVIEDGRKRLVVFMNDASRYCIVLDNIKAKDWAKLPKIFTERLRDVLLAEQINPDIIDRYLSEAGTVEYFRNNDKNMTARINKACEAARLGYRNHNGDVDISLFANYYLVGSKDEKNYFEPSERFHSMLSEYGLPLKRCRAFEFEVELEIKGGSVFRKIIVPSEIAFEQLANAIKKAFGWWDYKKQFHFLLYGNNGYTDLFLIQEDDPSSFSEAPSVVMTGIKISDLVPEKYRVFRFLYDYNAQWELCVTLKADYYNYVGEIPQLKSGAGNAPPEDVGGAEGYAEFLNALQNGKYAERQEKARWGKSYGYKEFDVEEVNKAVERSLKW